MDGYALDTIKKELKLIRVTIQLGFIQSDKRFYESLMPRGQETQGVEDEISSLRYKEQELEKDLERLKKE